MCGERGRRGGGGKRSKEKKEGREGTSGDVSGGERNRSINRGELRSLLYMGMAFGTGRDK